MVGFRIFNKKIIMYQELSKRTCKNLESDKLNLSHMLLGILSEIPELLTAIRKKDKTNLGEELGDICWYLSNYCTFRQLDFNKIKIKGKQNKPNLNFMMKKVLNYTDVVKKYVAYNKEIDKKEEIEFLGFMKYFVINMCDFYELSYLEILDKNIKKLKVRYPDIYTDFNALNRDLVNEVNVLK